MRDRRVHRGWPGSAAVIGAGTVRLGVAESFAAAGISVRLADATPELTRQAKEQLVERTRGHAEAGLVAAEAVDRAYEVGAAEGMLEAVRGVDFVFEAVPEDLDLKHDVLASCANGAPLEAVIVSNTSSLPIDDLAKSVRDPGRFLGMHWLTPRSGHRVSRSSPLP